MIRKDELEKRIVETDFPYFERTKHYKFTTLIAETMERIRPHFTEQVYITGIDNLRENSDPENPPIKGPLLYIIGHESWWDFVDLPPIWSALPRKPMLKVVARDNYSHFPPLDFLINRFFSPFTVTVQRSWNMEGLSDEEKEKLRKENNKKLNSLFSDENNSYDRAILPESSTKKNGAFNKIRSGAWRASHRVNNGKLEVLNCVPVGNTFDHISSVLEKHLTFVNIGEIFQYSPLEYIEGESEEDYTRRDIAAFAKVIKDRFVDLHTFTIGQLGGMSLLSRAMKRYQSFSRLDLLKEIQEAVEALKQIKDGRPVYIDPAVNNGDFSSRFNNFIENLHFKGYVSYVSNGTLRINQDRLMETPSNKRYKKDNPLRYLANKLIDVAQERNEVDWVVRDVFDFETFDYVIN